VNPAKAGLEKTVFLVNPGSIGQSKTGFQLGISNREILFGGLLTAPTGEISLR
jgi:hypothetical protein